MPEGLFHIKFLGFLSQIYGICLHLKQRHILKEYSGYWKISAGAKIPWVHLWLFFKISPLHFKLPLKKRVLITWFKKRDFSEEYNFVHRQRRIYFSQRYLTSYSTLYTASCTASTSVKSVWSIYLLNWYSRPYFPSIIKFPPFLARPPCLSL